MTCIVAVVDSEKNIHMGSDSLASDSHSQTVMTDSKLFMIGEMLVGFAGSFRSAQVLQYQVGLPDRGEMQEDMEYLVGSFIPLVRATFIESGICSPVEGVDTFDGEFLLGYRGKVYRMQCDFSLILAIDDFFSIGAASDAGNAVLYAIKNFELHPLERLRLALEAAEYKISSVKGPFHFVSIDIDGNMIDGFDENDDGVNETTDTFFPDVMKFKDIT